MKTKKRFLGILLGLALVLGLMPGMSLTAFADTTTYDPASTYAGFGELASGDDTVKIAGVLGYDWYVMGYDSDAGTVTLLSKQSFGNQDFNSDISKGNSYADSDIKTYVEGLTGEGQPLAGIKDALASVSVTDPAVTGKVPYLLSSLECYSSSETNVTKMKGEGTDWWLRSPGEYGNAAKLVHGGNGDMDEYNVNNLFGVRPALKLDLSNVVFDSETKTFAIPYPLRVGGMQVTCENLSGDGWSYDDGRKT